MTELEEKRERVILVAVSLNDPDETARSLSELKDLADTAGAFVAATVIQARESVHPGTYIGKGKIEEVKQMLCLYEADSIICDDELSPAQLGNLQEALGCKVCDRTLLILDIFAARAHTREGKIQVELAQLRYRSSRLVGLRSSLSRLGGGIGTRGPGEKKLEMDRRVIGERISVLKKELEEVKKHREVQRAGRLKNPVRTAAIVGYTNAGKSTLLNLLTGATVDSQDALFVTLDPTTRAYPLPKGGEVLLTDTVGFIRKLPHHLIDAFRSTLEEAVYADMIIHVVDSSNPQMEEQMKIVYETLDMLGVKDKPVLTLFNKIDKRTDTEPLMDERADRVMKVSAKTGEGFEDFPDIINGLIYGGRLYIERVYPYDQGGKVALIRNKGQLISEEYTAEGISVKAYIPLDIYGAVEA
ncbi:MAG: GTPase HflX [Lachnospiraceae bacterium]|nr:GTPase HflX [Lachnospiraceae bacterium]